MKQYFIICAMLALFTFNQTYANEYKSIPKELYSFMEGYKYEYGDLCTVAWDSKKSQFSYTGQCSIFPESRYVEDALKSIEFVKKNSKAKFFGMYFAEQNFYKSSRYGSKKEWVIQKSKQWLMLKQYGWISVYQSKKWKSCCL